MSKNFIEAKNFIANIDTYLLVYYVDVSVSKKEFNWYNYGSIKRSLERLEILNTDTST